MRPLVKRVAFFLFITYYQNALINKRVRVAQLAVNDFLLRNVSAVYTQRHKY